MSSEETGNAKSREALGLQLVITTRRYRRQLDAIFARRGLTDATSLPLRYLAARQHPLRQKDLADKLDIEGPTLVRALDVLVEKGFVRRSEDPDDRRARLVSATKKGRAFLAEIALPLRELRDTLFDGVGDEEIRGTVRLLERLEMNIAARAVRD